MKKKSFITLNLMLVALSILFVSCQKDGTTSSGNSIDPGNPIGPNNPDPMPQLPMGAIDGLFSINDTQQVFFSQGNLQYKASANTWKFADNQCDYVGLSNQYISETYYGWIDLFGWGTGNNPTNNSTNYDFYSSYYEWGDNAIINGGNSEHLWRTLTKEEWSYLLYTRNTPSGVRFIKAKIENVYGSSDYVCGILIFPDNWSNSTFPLYNVNNGYVDYTNNLISYEDWQTMLESKGVVLLPTAGHRDNVHFKPNDCIRDLGWGCRYWSSSTPNNAEAYYLMSGNDDMRITNDTRIWGRSVRLVCDKK